MVILYYPSFQQGQKRKDTMGTKRSLVKDEGVGQSVDLLFLITSLLVNDLPKAKKPKLYTFDTLDDSIREISQSLAASTSNAAVLIKTQVLGPCPNTCFACGGKGLSSGTLVTRMQTLIRTHDCSLMTCGS